MRVVAVVALRENDDTRGRALPTSRAYRAVTGTRCGTVGIARAGSRVLPRRSSSRVALRPRRVASERASEVDEPPSSHRGSASPLLLLRCVLLLFFLLHLRRLLLSLLRLSLPHVLYP